MSKSKIEIEESKEPEVIISQFGIREEDGDLYRVERDFFLNTKLGPLRPVRKGDLVRLSDKLAPELFHGGKISPMELSDVFEAVCDFRTIQNGEWFLVQKGDVVRLEKNEALEHLRAGNVKEKKGGKI